MYTNFVLLHVNDFFIDHDSWPIFLYEFICFVYMIEIQAMFGHLSPPCIFLYFPLSGCKQDLKAMYMNFLNFNNLQVGCHFVVSFPAPSTFGVRYLCVVKASALSFAAQKICLCFSVRIPVHLCVSSWTDVVGTNCAALEDSRFLHRDVFLCKESAPLTASWNRSCKRPSRPGSVWWTVRIA